MPFSDAFQRMRQGPLYDDLTGLLDAANLSRAVQ